MKNVDEIPRVIQSLYKNVHELETLFPGRKFTLDGHLVGSIGEVVAAHMYGITLLPNSTEAHDAKSERGKLVQIKATQRKSVALRSEPEHLVVLKLQQDGTAKEVFNGPGRLAWSNAGKKQRNGQRPIGLAKLRRLMDEVNAQDRLPSSV